MSCMDFRTLVWQKFHAHHRQRTWEALNSAGGKDATLSLTTALTFMLKEIFPLAQSPPTRKGSRFLDGGFFSFHTPMSCMDFRTLVWQKFHAHHRQRTWEALNSAGGKDIYIFSIFNIGEAYPIYLVPYQSSKPPLECSFPTLCHASTGLLRHHMVILCSAKRFEVYMEVHPNAGGCGRKLEVVVWCGIQSTHLENKLLLISINFTPKNSHSCVKTWYFPMFSTHLVLTQTIGQFRPEIQVSESLRMNNITFQKEGQIR